MSRSEYLYLASRCGMSVREALMMPCSLLLDFMRIQGNRAEERRLKQCPDKSRRE